MTKREAELLAMVRNIQRLTDAECTMMVSGVQADCAAPPSVTALRLMTTGDQVTPCTLITVGMDTGCASVLVCINRADAVEHPGSVVPVTSGSFDVRHGRFIKLDPAHAYLFTTELAHRVRGLVKRLRSLIAVRRELGKTMFTGDVLRVMNNALEVGRC